MPRTPRSKLLVPVINHRHGIEAGKFQIGQPEIIRRGRRKMLEPMSQIVAEIANGAAAEFVRTTLSASLAELSGLTPKQLIDDRYDKFRKMGSFFTENVYPGASNIPILYRYSFPTWRGSPWHPTPVCSAHRYATAGRR